MQDDSLRNFMWRAESTSVSDIALCGISLYVRLKEQVSQYNEFLYMLFNIKNTSYKVKNYNDKINIFRI